jgi:tRNA-specific 2-thiouridylase
VATGHYGRVEHRADGPHLFRSRSPKDQAYALAQLAPDQLGRLLLPLGTFTKDETRAHAARLGLTVATKTESQDICFVEGGDYRDVLAALAPETARPGAVVTTAGETVGDHAGIGGYTLGQRRRLPAGPQARYVTRIDAATNTIVIGGLAELASTSLVAEDVNLIRPERFANGPVEVLAMTRYRAQPAHASATVAADGTLRVRFVQPQLAVTPGQLVAILDPAGEEVLAGATIRDAA